MSGIRRLFCKKTGISKGTYYACISRYIRKSGQIVWDGREKWEIGMELGRDWAFLVCCCCTTVVKYRKFIKKGNVWLSSLKKVTRFEFEKQDRSGIYGFTQRNLAYNSNKIEGSTLTVIQQIKHCLFRHIKTGLLPRMRTTISAEQM